MSKSKYIIILAVVALVAAFGVVTVVSGGTEAKDQPPCHVKAATDGAAAPESCPKMGQGMGMCGQGGGCMAKLTGPAKEAHDAYKQDTAGLRTDLATARAELSTLLKSSSPDRAKVMAAVDKVNTLQGNLYKETVDMYLKVGPSMAENCGMDPVQCTMMMSDNCPMKMGKAAGAGAGAGMTCDMKGKAAGSGCCAMPK